MKLQCPVCKNREDIRLSRYEGFWERYLWSLLLLRPYRCWICSRRFYRLTLQNGVNDVKRAKWWRAQEKQFPQFFKVPDEKEFQELIWQIREEERNMEIFGQIENPMDLVKPILIKIEESLIPESLIPEVSEAVVPVVPRHFLSRLSQVSQLFLTSRTS